MESRKILVIGATGQQGGALIEALLVNKSHFDIYGLTRNKASPPANRLAERGMKLIEGDVTAPLPIFRKVGGNLWGVFSVTTRGDNEEQEAVPLIDAAIANNVQYFVFTSADRGGPVKSDADPTNVPHLLAKFNIEKYLIEKAAKSPQRMMWTILRPVMFMENFAPDFVGKLTARLVCINGDVPIQLVSTQDIGKVAARAFEDSEHFNGRALTLAGERLNYNELTKIFTEEVGHDLPIAPAVLVWIALFFKDDTKKMSTWFQQGGYAGSIEDVKMEAPGLTDFRTWLRTSSKWVKRT